MTRSQLDLLLTRISRAVFYSLLSVGCLLIPALCGSPSTYAPLEKNFDGSIMLDASGQPIIIRNWHTSLVNAVPTMVPLLASAVFLVLAAKCFVTRRSSPQDKQTE